MRTKDEALKMACPSPKWNPCIGCGACCASYRVSFYWREAEASDAEHPVPLPLCEELGGSFRCMKGTNSKHSPSCVALKGKIGETVRCTIYENRPSTCRDFFASYEDGKPNQKCDEARRRHGLKPLTREDWHQFEVPPAPTRFAEAREKS